MHLAFLLPVFLPVLLPVLLLVGVIVGVIVDVIVDVDEIVEVVGHRGLAPPVPRPAYRTLARPPARKLAEAGTLVLRPPARG